MTSDPGVVADLTTCNIRISTPQARSRTTTSSRHVVRSTRSRRARGLEHGLLGAVCPYPTRWAYSHHRRWRLGLRVVSLRTCGMRRVQDLDASSCRGGRNRGTRRSPAPGRRVRTGAGSFRSTTQSSTPASHLVHQCGGGVTILTPGRDHGSSLRRRRSTARRTVRLRRSRSRRAEARCRGEPGDETRTRSSSGCLCVVP